MVSEDRVKALLQSAARELGSSWEAEGPWPGDDPASRTAAMRKIASPNELQAELRAIMAFVHGHGPEGKPDRRVVAAKLNELADRVGGRSTTPVFKYRAAADVPELRSVTAARGWAALAAPIQKAISSVEDRIHDAFEKFSVVERLMIDWVMGEGALVCHLWFLADLTDKKEVEDLVYQALGVSVARVRISRPGQWEAEFGLNVTP